MNIEVEELDPDLEEYCPDECPACGSTDLHSASLGGEAAVSCCDCVWIATYASLRENYDPSSWCSACGARRQRDCHCGPIAEND